MAKKDAPVRKEKWTDADEKAMRDLIAKRMRLLPVMGHEIVNLVNQQNEPRKETARAAGAA